MQASENSNDDFLFIDDSDEDEILAQGGNETWQVLIVDDDPEIHSVTQLALSDLVVLGRHLEYVHAYSGSEACKLIEENPEIVLVLLDVVMETDDAGLNVVKHIRENLNRQDIRIVLRTGQPGYAPEESVIKEYDINDYKTKTELTRRKLVTTVFAAIRSYQQIATVNENRAGLESIVAGSTELSSQHSISAFCASVLEQLKNLVTDGASSVFCARGQGIIDNVDDLSFYVLAQNGHETALVNQKLEQLKSEQANKFVKTCFLQQQHQIADEHLSLYIAKGDYRAVIFVELATPLSETQTQLLHVFLSGVSVGYENVHLFQKLSNAAYKDWLTNLPNRLEFLRLLDDFSQQNGEQLVAALIDINHFSDINDALGQDIGNQLLTAVAKRMLEIGSICKFARVGADVFGIIGPVSIVTPENLMGLFHHPFSAGEQHLPINACFGFCTKEHAENSGVKVLNQINIALNLAKKNRLEHFAFYNPEMEDQMQWRLGMIRQLRNDFATNCLELWYQPQLSLASGKVIGAEALLRWRTADGNYVSPAVFIPLAEYSGLIIEIGDWVIKQACQQIQRLENTFGDISISVNVSIPQFRRDDFVDTVIGSIKAHQIDPSKLELEITENILMDDPQLVVDALIKLKSEGISIALDDFGTGYSSLSYLQKLPLDRLKVDRAFVTNIAEEGQSVIAETIINLGKKMELKVIAEGIEELKQQERLLELGCDEVQGFYYAKPMPEKDFIEFLNANH
ncbi:bifunctional diguanylate cyclase/phosphodiesterase [Litorilituus lipolyticus]|uniref:EAL domain-containing protein n=1 Tax=Litorilituus lipolyticus TaxID=2491017 RepID=A0A502KX75_9GAMM|nr:EAL domain-containing protein [Litorilituus lipolyticus]TPH16106.1 EAL domain-containing protein [Litorilituus lipolyticus]